MSKSSLAADLQSLSVRFVAQTINDFKPELVDDLLNILEPVFSCKTDKYV